MRHRERIGSRLVHVGGAGRLRQPSVVPIILAAILFSAGQLVPVSQAQSQRVAGAARVQHDAQAAIERALGAVQKLTLSERWSEAVPLARHALQLAEALLGGQHETVGTIALTLASLHRRLGDHESAIAPLRRALVVEAAEAGPESDRYRELFGMLAGSYRATGRFVELTKLHADALDAIEEAADETAPARAYYLRSFGRLLCERGDCARAVGVLRQALAIETESAGAGAPAAVESRVALSQALIENGEAELAVTELMRADIDGAGPAVQAEALVTLGRALGMGSPPGDAVAALEAGLAMAQLPEGPSGLVVGQAHAELGRLQLRAGAAAAAETEYRRSIAALERELPRGDRRLSRALAGLRDALHQQGLYESALATANEVVAAIAMRPPEWREDLPLALERLAVAEESLGRKEAALATSRKAVEVARELYGSESEAFADALLRLASRQQTAGLADDARLALRQAVAASTAVHGEGHGDTLPPLLRLARTLGEEGRHTEELAALRRAIAIAAWQRPWSGSSPAAPDGLDDAVDRLLEASRRVGENGEALKQELAAETFMLAQEPVARAQRRASAPLHAGDVGTPHGRLLDSLVSEAADRERAVRELERELGAWRARPLSGRRPATERQLEKRIHALRGRMAELDRDVAAEVPRFASYVRPAALSVEQVRALLPQNAALVVFHAGATRVTGWVVTHDRLDWQPLAISRAGLAAASATLRCGVDPEAWRHIMSGKTCAELVGSRNADDLLPFDRVASARLYRNLMLPFADAVAGRELIVVAPDELAGIPFEALVAERFELFAEGSTASGLIQPGRDPTPWLIREHAVSVLPSVSSLAVGAHAVAAPGAGRRSYLALGRADGAAAPTGLGDGLDIGACAEARGKGRDSRSQRSRRAPSRAREQADGVAQARESLCDDAMVLGLTRLEPSSVDLTSPDAIRAASRRGGLTDYRMLHLAAPLAEGSRGSDMPRLPALEFATVRPGSVDPQRLLTTLDIATLGVDAEWALLSAFDERAATAGEPAGRLQLAHALLHAGARTVLVEQWPTDQVARLRLTADVVRNLRLRPADGRAEALRWAMLRMLGEAGDARWRHPQTWARLRLVGLGSAPPGLPLAAASARSRTADGRASASLASPDAAVATRAKAAVRTVADVIGARRRAIVGNRAAWPTARARRASAARLARGGARPGLPAGAKTPDWVRQILKN